MMKQGSIGAQKPCVLLVERHDIMNAVYNSLAKYFGDRKVRKQYDRPYSGEERRGPGNEVSWKMYAETVTGTV
jgi:hypothetical protein